MSTSSPKAVIMDEASVSRAMTRIAHEILERNEGCENLAIVGIVTRGDLLAKELVDRIREIEGVDVPLGSLDISFYRDDFQTHFSPEVHATDIPFDVDGKRIVLVDDILYTGRTIRCALDAVMDLGRPSRVELAVAARPRPPRAAHLPRLRGQERSVLPRGERPPVPEGGRRAHVRRDHGSRRGRPRGLRAAGR